MTKKEKNILTLVIFTLIALFCLSFFLFLNQRNEKLGVVSGINYLKNSNAFIVQSGSMEPVIKTGSLVFTYPQDYYAPGDIVTFEVEGKKETVTHRINFKTYEGSFVSPTYITSGDANEDLDTWRVKDGDIKGKVVFSAPYAGYLANFAKTPQGFIMLVIVPATIIIYEEIKNVLGQIIAFFAKGFKKRKRTEKKEIDAVNLGWLKVFAVLPVFGAVLVLAAFSGSFFSDIEKVAGNVLRAKNTFPTSDNGQNETKVVINEIMWMGSTESAYDEWIELRNLTDSPIDISGWVVENLGSGNNNDIVIPEESMISANGYFVISNYQKEDSILAVDADFVTASVSLANAGEQLILKNTQSEVVDMANIEVGWLAGDKDAKHSMARNADPGDGSDASFWHTSLTSANLDPEASELATPGAPN